MKSKGFLIALLTIAIQAMTISLMADTPGEVSGTLGSTPLYFTENRGQWDERVLFKADGGNGVTWWFERDGLTLAVTAQDTSANAIHPERSEGSRPEPLPARRDWQDELRVGCGEPTPARRKGHALKLRFVPSRNQSSDLVFASNTVAKQSQPAAEVIPSGKLSWNNNYFLGNDESKWAPDCGNFTRLTYRNVWEGIDVVYYGQGQSLKYDYVVKPGGDPANIRLRWLGLDAPLSVIPAQAGIQNANADVDADADVNADAGKDALLLATSVGTLREGIPLAYQRGEDGSRIPVEVGFAVLSENEVGLEVNGDWDRAKELVVDPLVWSTYLGGNEQDQALSICPDGEGGWVVAGYSYGGSFPTTQGAFQRNFGGGTYDAVITRIDSQGSRLIYSTFIGGSDLERIYSLCQDRGGGIAAVGYTVSANFPTTEDAISRNRNGELDDAFIVRLNANGSSLLYSSYFGGTDQDRAYAICPNGEDDLLVAGWTMSSNFPTTAGTYDRSFNDVGNPIPRGDGFVSRLNGENNRFIFSTYLGGNSAESIRDIYLSEAGEVTLAGETYSNNFPATNGAFQRNFTGGNDAFVAALNLQGNELLFSTYLGGNGSDVAESICPDGRGGISVTGKTRSNNFPVSEGAYDSEFGGDVDAFVAGINEDGSRLLYATYLGAALNEEGLSVCPDGLGGAVITGFTKSADFPTTENAFNRQHSRAPFWDIFITWMSSDGSELLYSTFISADHYSQGQAIINDGGSGVVLTGYTRGDEFPTTEGAYDRSYNDGGVDAFITRIDIGLPTLRWTDVPDTVTANEGVEVRFVVRSTSSDENAELTLEYSSPDLPEAANFNDNGDWTGEFVWQTGFDDEGEYTAIFTLSDGENEISADVVIIVSNVNREPVWAELPESIVVDELEDITFNVTASDPDGDSLSLSADSENLPEGWTFTDNENNTGTFTWQTTFDDAGEYSAIFTLSDGEYELADTVVIIVNNVNRPPEWINISNSVEVNEGEELTFAVSAFDPDGDPDNDPQYPWIWATSEDLPEGWLFSVFENLGSFFWVTDYDDAGDYTVTFFASDDSSQISADCRILVNDVVGVPNPEGVFPLSLILYPSFPNPFNSSTTIHFGLPVASEVTLRITDTNGRLMTTLVEHRFEAGYHDVVWNAAGFAAGIYLVELRAGEQKLLQKVAVAR